jgi:hypothetical protein
LVSKFIFAQIARQLYWPLRHKNNVKTGLGMSTCNLCPVQ